MPRTRHPPLEFRPPTRAQRPIPQRGVPPTGLSLLQTAQPCPPPLARSRAPPAAAAAAARCLLSQHPALMSPQKQRVALTRPVMAPQPAVRHYVRCRFAAWPTLPLLALWRRPQRCQLPASETCRRPRTPQALASSRACIVAQLRRYRNATLAAQQRQQQPCPEAALGWVAAACPRKSESWGSGTHARASRCGSWNSKFESATVWCGTS
jgi:hypothetical protein